MNAYQELQTSRNQSVQNGSLMLNPAFHSKTGEPSQLPEPNQGLAILVNFEKQMSDFAAEHEALLERVRKQFVLPADSSVVTFLTEHRSLPQILLEAVVQLKSCFGDATVFNLSAPLDESEARTLYAVVLWPGTVQDARKALAKFDDGWWIARSRQASGHLTFTYELV